MQAVDKALFYIFALSLLLVLVAYYTGASTDISAIGSTLNTLILSATGRNAQGAFAGYPAGSK